MSHYHRDVDSSLCERKRRRSEEVLVGSVAVKYNVQIVANRHSATAIETSNLVQDWASLLFFT